MSLNIMGGNQYMKFKQLTSSNIQFFLNHTCSIWSIRLHTSNENETVK